MTLEFLRFFAYRFAVGIFGLGLIYIDRLIGTDDPNVSFNKDHLKLMHVIAHQAAVAIENEEFLRCVVRKRADVGGWGNG